MDKVSREEYIKFILDDPFDDIYSAIVDNWVIDGVNYRELFSALTMDTYEELSVIPNMTNVYRRLTMDTDIGFSYIRMQKFEKLVTPQLIQRWEQWDTEFFEKLVAANPKLEMYYAMKDISEADDCSSWLWGREQWALDWVLGGEYANSPIIKGDGRFTDEYVDKLTAEGITKMPPFVDRGGWLTEPFFNRLCELQKISGGWLYKDDDLKLHFRPTTKRNPK